jgi:hypothetical protein
MEANGDAAAGIGGTGGSFKTRRQKSRRDLFFDEMNQVVPWCELEAFVKSHYSEAVEGRQTADVRYPGDMPRSYFVQFRFDLSNLAVKETLNKWPARNQPQPSAARERTICGLSELRLRGRTRSSSWRC